MTIEDSDGSEVDSSAAKPTGSTGPGRQEARRRGAMRSVVVAAGIAVALVLGAGVAWAAVEPGGIAEVQRFASRLTNYVTAVAASVAVLFMAVNGIRYTVSNGNPSRQIEAKNGLLSAAVGLAVALSANVLVQLVVAALG
jgi:hypothetical protein